MTLSREEWARLLGAAPDEPSVGQLAEALAGARDRDVNEAHEAVETAVADGPLVEEREASGFGTVRLAAGESAESGAESGRDGDPGPQGADPRPPALPPARGDMAASWGDARFDEPESGVYPPERLEREQWMGHVEKQPFAPWADADAPVPCTDDEHDADTCAECECDARFKWGYTENYVDGETVALAEDDPRLDGRAFLQQFDDPFAYVDGDDVRDPETGEVHPAFLDALECLGVSYADVSQSGAGVHVLYRGELPDGVKEASWQLDNEPWGANDERPSIEIYDRKRVCVDTGEHVPGTPVEIRGWDSESLRDLLDEHGQIPTQPSTDREDYDLDDYTPDVTAGGTPTADIRDVFSAIDDLDAQAVAEKTVVDQWNDSASTSAGERAFYADWGDSDDNGRANIVNDDRWQDTGDRGGYGGPVVMAAYDANLVSERNATPDNVRGGTWLEAVEHLREELNISLPVWVPEADGEREQTPLWALRRVAVAADLLDRSAFVEREGDDDGTYQGFPDAESYNAVLDLLEEHDIVHGRDRAGGVDDADYRPDPREVEVVLDPQRAWDAAGRVTPADLETPVDLPTTDDGEAWRPREADARVDVVRAVAIAEGTISAPDEPLGEEYADAYARAREHYGAPLPRYLTHADAVERYDYAVGAVRELTFWHLDRDALTLKITAEGDAVGGDAVATLDPTPLEGWRDSESGESVLVFPSGTVYDVDLGEDGRVIDPLRLVACDAGLVDDPTAALEGETFTEAYRLAREEYGAPLPRWRAGAPEVTPVLPPAEDLVADAPEVETEIADLQAETEALYREVVDDRVDGPVVLNVLPALGKTTAAIKTASEEPTTYLAPRKELMQQAEATAEEFGVSYHHLPVFAGRTVKRDVLASAVGAVRETGKDALRDIWGFYERVDGVEGGIFEDDEGEDDGEADDDEDVDLDRSTCPTAEGVHGDAWALAVHTARELDYTPRDIHEKPEAIFGRPLPCQCDADDPDADDEAVHDCDYSEAWDAVADPDAPVDLLIGHYTHAHVESARTHYARDEDDSIVRTPRVLAVDEFPGLSYADEFGEEAADHAVWLASALDPEVEDRQDLIERDLWADPWVGAWLAGEVETGEDVPDRVADAAQAATALQARAQLLEAVDEVGEILDGYEDLLETHGLADDVRQLHDRGADMTADELGKIAEAVRETVEDLRHGADGRGVLTWLRDTVTEAVAGHVGDVDVDVDALPAAGELAAFVERALETDDPGMLRGAATALEGGDDGARELAVWADDGYAHRKAHYLLEGAIRPEGDDVVARIETEQYAYGDRRGDGTVLKHVGIGEQVTTLWDRNHQGGEILLPPPREAGGGTCPLVGLDATARRELWGVALGEPVRLRDVHDTAQERAEALQDVHGLQLIQTADRVLSYEGGPDGLDLDTPVALLEEIAEQYAGVRAPRDRDGEPERIGKPAVITTNDVKAVLEADDRLRDVVATWENYGNLKGSNALGRHTLGAILGCQHYGDGAVERFAAFAGEEVDRQDHGHRLDYGGPVANEYLAHMRQDQTMQAALRFTRGETGAVVFAHTAALREDLPVVGRGEVVRSWSDTATQIAEAWQRQPDARFTARDLADAVDASARHVRRVLAEFAEAGYLERHDPGEGLANEYRPLEEPGAGEAELEPGIGPPGTAGPGQSALDIPYTAHVRVSGVGDPALPAARAAGSTLPAPNGGEAGLEAAGDTVSPG